MALSRLGISVGIVVGALAAWLGVHALRPPPPATPSPEPPTAGESPAPESPHETPLRFTMTELPFVYERGDTGKALPVEPIGGGVALLDFDGDGLLDLFFPQGVPLPVGSAENPPADVLMRNNGGRKFTAISASVGLTSKGYGVGAVAADYDGDGWVDVYVTRYGKNTLWRNVGGRQFVDVTDASGTGCDRFSLGAAFADFDGDGWLDLYVANYLEFDPAAAPYDRNPRTGAPEYALPAAFGGQSPCFYRNQGNGRFEELTERAGLARLSKAMGVLAADFNADGWIDLLVANDGEPNTLWINRGNGRFQDLAHDWGVAVNGAGAAEANMGIAYGDVDGNGKADILITHFLDEHDTLWCNLGTDRETIFVDRTRQAGLANASIPLTGWGVAFADFDHDGWLDAFVANGHIRHWPGRTYEEANPPLVWHNLGGRRFRDVAAASGTYGGRQHRARGLAIGDLDNDGDLDVVIVHHYAKAVVLWNESRQVGPSRMVRLVGAFPNLQAIGASVVVRSGGRTQWRWVVGGGSYLSSHDPRLHFGLGEGSVVEEIEVHWPLRRGEVKVTRLPAEAIPPDGELVVREEATSGVAPAGEAPRK